MEVPNCYGKMFPTVVQMVANQSVSGKVFGYELEQVGIGARRRTATANRAAWEECSVCPQFDTCGRLSQGSLLMELAVKSV